ncbi:MAG: PD-(D/E)XK nuclease family protein [Spirochaetales bacterium]|nr:PD-(D/E)XK nuclease family protein [Spirochaetales bacterium]
MLEILHADKIATELNFYSSNGYHGIIDLVIEKDSNLTIYDFKSDIPGDNFTELQAHYKKQLKYYEDAAKEFSGGNNIFASECIYLFK